MTCDHKQHYRPFGWHKYRCDKCGLLLEVQRKERTRRFAINVIDSRANSYQRAG